MKNSSLLNLFVIVMCAFFCVSCKSKTGNKIMDPAPTIYNPTGTWSYTGIATSYNAGNCGFGSNPFASFSGTIVFSVNGSSITGNASNGVTYVGLYEDNAAALLASYASAIPGYVETDVFSFGLTSSNQGSGTFTWGLTNGAQSCSGVNSLTGSRI